MKYLGIDYGTKRIGIALSDESGAIAFPHSIISADEKAASAATALAATEGVTDIVVGESTWQGADNPVMSSAHEFATALEEKGLRVHLISEALTSYAARSAPSKPDQSRNLKKNREPVDAHAAALILQRYLDTIRG